MDAKSRVAPMVFSLRNYCFCCISALCLSGVSFAGDSDQEILNQLYQEIINSSPAIKSMKMDTIRTLGKTKFLDQEMVTVPEKNSGPASEQLKKEMEKVLQDAQLRHSDAIKFMQDPK
jgi:hypothetical protein